MLSQVDASNSQGDLISLLLDDDTTGYVLENIDGLDPVQAVLVSTSYATQDGQQYQNSRRDARNLKFKLSLEPDYVNTSVESLRNSLYNVFMPKSQVNLKFYRDSGFQVTIVGRVESCDAPLFTDDPEADISVMCFAPDFIDPVAKTFNGSTTNVAAISMGADTLINYPGTVEAGFVFTMTANRAVPSFSIDLVTPDGVTQPSLIFNQALSSGDKIVISTVPGAKYATLTRAGVDSSMLYGVTPTSHWHQLFRGNNHLRVYDASGAAIPFAVQYTVRYGAL